MTAAVWQEEKRGLNIVWEHALAAIPMLLLAYPFLIWPLVYGVKVDGNLFNDLSVAVAQSSGNDTLNQVYFPFLLIATFGLILLQGTRPSTIIFHRSFLIMGLLFSVFLVSAVWSGNPTVAIKRVFLQLLMTVPILLACASIRRMDLVLNYFHLFMATLILINFAYVLVVPAGPIGHEGIYPQKNYLGQVAAFGVLFMVFRILAARGIDRMFSILLCLMAIITTLASQSKTSLGLMLLTPFVGMILMFFAYYFRLATGLITVLGLTTIIFIFWLGRSADVWTLGTIAEFIFGDPTLTRRTDIWDFTNTMIAQRPVIGYGFGSFWSTGSDGVSFREAPGFIAKLTHAHNGYVDLLLQVGILGAVPFLLYIISIGNTFGRVAFVSPALCWFATTMYVYAITQNLTESTWFFSFEGMSVVTMALLVISVRVSMDPSTLGRLGRR